MSLSDQESSDYVKVKKQLLQAYSLVHESYSQAFIFIRKTPKLLREND